MSLRVGERTTDDRPLEWTGEVWAPVCPVCNIPMAVYNEQRWLCCGTCGLRAVDR